MPFSEKARQYAFDTLEARRQSAVAKSINSRREIFMEHPELQGYDEAIASLGISLTKAAILGDIDISAITVNLNEIKKKRSKYIKKNNVDPDKSFFCCKKCNDTGYIGDNLCSCTIELMIEYTSKLIASVSPLSLSSFADFDLEFYSTKPDSEHKNISPRKNMEKILKACLSFTKSFPKYQNLLFMGYAGLGKTHLALAIANEIIKKENNVVYCNAANIFKAIEAEYFQENGNTETIDTMKICDLLIIDDLGAEYVNNFLASSLYDIVNTRMGRNLPTIYTTNILKHEILETRYGEKVSSRLLGLCKMLMFYGEDHRLNP